MIKTVIFDMDGTLIDSEKLYLHFWPQAFAEVGIHMTGEQALAMRSMGRPFRPVLVREMFGDAVDYDAVNSRCMSMVDAYLENVKVERKPGAVELLKYLREKGIQTAVATASALPRAEKFLKDAEVYEYFDELISSTMVKEGKPAPDIYLHACHVLGRSPQECIAVEDSPNGVLSAYRAGCNVVMVPDLTQPDEELQTMLYACVDNLWEISKLV